MGQPAVYYVIPEHQMYLSDDRTELVFEQRLPQVRKENVNIEVLEKSICLDFRAEGKQRMARCLLPALRSSIRPRRRESSRTSCSPSGRSCGPPPSPERN